MFKWPKADIAVAQTSLYAPKKHKTNLYNLLEQQKPARCTAHKTACLANHCGGGGLWRYAVTATTTAVSSGFGGNLQNSTSARLCGSCSDFMDASLSYSLHTSICMYICLCACPGVVVLLLPLPVL